MLRATTLHKGLIAGLFKGFWALFLEGFGMGLSEGLALSLIPHFGSHARVRARKTPSCCLCSVPARPCCFNFEAGSPLIPSLLPGPSVGRLAQRHETRDQPLLDELLYMALT